MRILVSGASGYIGSRLVPELLAKNYTVRVLVRDVAKIKDRPWFNEVEVAAGDAYILEDVEKAMKTVDAAFFLLHALSPSKTFMDNERKLAYVFGEAALAANVKKIVYLGGLINKSDDPLSPHLKSRETTGTILRTSGVPTIELRAAVIIGSGSVSFEMLRYLTERLPVMTTPTWVRSKIQPISIRDVLRYLVTALELPEGTSRTFDIGGPEVLSYEKMMQQYARIAGVRKRIIIPVPVLSPGLSSHWVGVITPVPPTIAKPLVDSLKHDVVCLENDIKKYIPDPPQGLLNFDESCAAALKKIKNHNIPSRWTDASTITSPAVPYPGDPSWSGGTLYTDYKEVEVNAPVATVWGVVSSIGGETGWFSPMILWRIRGFLDRIFGGPGLRRSRREPYSLRVGDALDFYRVEKYEPLHLLLLRAEMRLPGVAWLEFKLETLPNGKTKLIQKATYYPKGLAGILYWKSISIFHFIVFSQMITNMKKTSESR